METIELTTERRDHFLEITDQVASLVSKSKIQSGSVFIYVPHTTAGITINENADPDVVHDMLLTFSGLVPKDAAGYRHAEGNSDSHVKASLMGFSCEVLIDRGRLVLGTWQGIYFCEFDGPRRRRVHLQLRSCPTHPGP